MISTKTFHGLNGPYLTVYTLIKIAKLSICIHHFHRGDEDPEPHDHPFWFYSCVLSGGYREVLEDDTHIVRKPFSIAHRSATHRHRVELLSPEEGCWTICIKYDVNRRWGFWKAGQFIYWKDYLRAKGIEPYKD